MIKKAMAGILLILGIAGVYYFSKKKSVPVTENAGKTKQIHISKEVLARNPFEYVKLREKGIYEDILLPGVVSYDLEATVKVGARVPGRINEVFVKEGDRVKKGAPLISISSIVLGSTEADYLKAKVKLDTMKSQAERAKELFDKKISSAKEYEMAMMELRVVRTELETSRITLENYGLSKINIKELENGKSFSQNFVMYSPISGTVTERKAIIGQSVEIQNNLFTISDLNHVWVILNIYEKDFNSVERGVEATLFTIGTQEEVAKAYVMHVGEVVDPVQKTAQIRLEVTKNKKLKPGQSITAKVKGLISQDKSRKIFVVPQTAVHSIEGKKIVFVAGDGDFFVPVEVKVGITTEGDIEILSGLKQDENIVNEGSFLLKSEYLK